MYIPFNNLTFIFNTKAFKQFTSWSSPYLHNQISIVGIY